MNRVLTLFRADIRFQFRYGFYGLYAIVTLLYAVCIRLLPVHWREAARIVTVFSDPAALGLFFMGAILLFEKGEQVLPSLAVSPVRIGEYVLSKMLSIAVVSVLAGLAIVLASGGRPGPGLLAGLLGGSFLFTLTGIVFGSGAATINRFLIITVPAELCIMLPSLAWQFGFRPPVLLLHPGVIVIALFSPGSVPALPAFFLLSLWLVLFFALACRAASRMFIASSGGAAV